MRAKGNTECCVRNKKNRQGPHCKGKMAKKNHCQGRRREFEILAKTRNIVCPELRDSIDQGYWEFAAKCLFFPP